MPKADDTRLAILRAAERLFAARGVDSVSLREIAMTAGQRNHSAVLYHFGDKRELLEALLHRHSGVIDEGFPVAIARLRENDEETLPALVALLVRPLVDKLDDEDGGADYLQICAELTVAPSFPLTSMRAANGEGSQQLTSRLLAHIGGMSPVLLPLRMLRIASTVFGSITVYRRLTVAGLQIPRATFREDLEASVVALLALGDPSCRERSQEVEMPQAMRGKSAAKSSKGED